MSDPKHIALTREEHLRKFKEAKLKAQNELNDPDLDNVEVVSFLCTRYMKDQE